MEIFRGLSEGRRVFTLTYTYGNRARFELGGNKKKNFDTQTQSKHKRMWNGNGHSMHSLIECGIRVI
jgi:hypothetical protein